MTEKNPEAVTYPHQAFSGKYRGYVLALLTLGYVFNFVDRQVMTILLEPIKAEFGASDAQMGLLSGLAFALFYATLGIPVARLADRWSRRNVLAISMATWSVVTALCSTASSFMQLALLRVGVGIGEAGGTPPSQSLITDYFPPERRALAQGVFAIAPNIGILVGLFGGALIAEALGWRSVFLVFGVPGVLLSLLLYLTVKEPARVASDPSDRSLWSGGHRSTAGLSLDRCRRGFCRHLWLWPGGLVPQLPGKGPRYVAGRRRLVVGFDWGFWWRIGNDIKRRSCRSIGPAGSALAAVGPRHWLPNCLAYPACVFAVAGNCGI